jgi:hypothetical protein
MIKAIAAMEHSSRGQMGQPASRMIENNPVLSGDKRFFGRAIMALQRDRANDLQPSLPFKRQCGFRNPLQLWITLWATGPQPTQGHENSGLSTDCSKLKQKEVIENQPLARL